MYPLESDRMVFRHVRAHDQDGIGSWKISLCCGSAATAKRCAQTGHSRSYVIYRAWLLMQFIPRPAANSFLIR